MKRCARCEEEKPPEAFYPHRRAADGLQSYCSKCCCEATAAWRKNNPVEMKASNRRTKYFRSYGLTVDIYESMLEAQDRRCAICLSESPGRYDHFRIDHEHATGRIRGLLCNRCNLLLGQARDSQDHLRAAAAYLDQHKGAS